MRLAGRLERLRQALIDGVLPYEWAVAEIERAEAALRGLPVSHARSA